MNSMKQKEWLALHIDLNTKNRAATTVSFGKELQKLANNAFKGRAMENVKNKGKKVRTGPGGSIKLKKHSKINFDGAKSYHDSRGGLGFDFRTFKIK